MPRGKKRTITTATTFKNAPSGWKVVSTKKVYSNPYLAVYEDSLDLAGRSKTYVRAVRKDYSTVVPFVSSDEILAIKSYRHLVDSYQVEVPSGYIEKGETPANAAKRELLEETGFRARRLVPLGAYSLDYSMFEQRGNVFAAYSLSKAGKQKLGRMEKIELEVLSVKEVGKLLEKGEILNAASMVALYRALDYHHHRHRRRHDGARG